MMTYPTRLNAALLTVTLGLTVSAVQAGSLKDIGNAAAYPFKKGAHNASKTARTGAGQASKGLNHAGQVVQYPVRKTGENASKTTHKSVQDVKK